jgi:hypothetical protein
MSQTAESIVTSLEWSRKLKEAGWPQPVQDAAPFWFWYEEKLHLMSGRETDSGCYGPCWSYKDGHIDDWSFENRNPHISAIAAAPTAEEILRRLPEEFGECCLDAHRFLAHEGFWRVCYEVIDDGKHDMPHHVLGDTLANAAAAMYCYLAENALLTPPV